MMSKTFHMNGVQASKVIICHLIFLLAALNSVWAGILIYDGSLGIEEFRDVELSNTEPISKDGIMGAIVAASPIDACTNISRPPNVNISMNWFVLIAGNSCSFEVKVLNARYAGYAVAVIYITETRIPHFIRTNNGYYSFFPNISAVVIGSDQGRRIRDNYLFDIDERFRVYIFPNNSFSIMTFLLLFSIVTGLFLVVMLVFAVIRFFQHSNSAQRGRLSSRHLKQLQTSTYSKGDGSDSCAICLEEYKDQDKLRFLPCSHGYHARCIDPWLTNNRPICPVCKQKVVLDGHNSDNNRDSDFDERSETTPLLQDRRDTQHGTFNLIYNPNGENVGDLNLPSTSVTENVGRVRVLRKSVSGPGGMDSSNNSVNENLSGNNSLKDPASQNVGIIKRLVFLKNSPKTLGSSDVSIPSTSNNANVLADPVVVDLVDTDLPSDSAVLNITDVGLPKTSVVGIGLSSNSGSTNIGGGANLSSNSAVANVGGVNLPGDTMTGYVAGSNLSEFWPSDHLNKIKLSNDSLSRNQDSLNLSGDVSENLGGANLSGNVPANLGGANLSGEVSANLGGANLSGDASANLGGANLSGGVSANLGGANLSGDVSANLGGLNLSSDVSANLGGTNLSGDAKVNLDGGIVSSNSAAIGDINLLNQPISVNLDGINLAGESAIGNLGITAASNSVAANLRSVNAPSDLDHKGLGGIIAAVDSAASNPEPSNVSSGSIATNLGVSVTGGVVPTNLGIDLPVESIATNLDGSNLSSGISVSANLGGVHASSPFMSANLEGINVTSPSIGANLGSVNVSSPSISANLGGINVSGPPTSANLGSVSISSPSMSANLGNVNVSSPLIAVGGSGISVSSPRVDSNPRGGNLSSPSVAASLGGINASHDTGPINLGIGISTGSAAAASHSDASLTNKPVAANRRRRRK